MMPSKHIILLSPSPPALNLSKHQGLFQWACSSHQVTKVLELQHQSFQWIFRNDWFDLLAVQGTLKSLLQHHSSKVSILQCLSFFMVLLSHPFMTTGKTKVLTIQTFVSKVMPLLFNTLSRFIKALLPRSKCLLILWLQSASTVILEPKKYFYFFPFCLPWCDGTRWHDLRFLNVEFQASFFTLLFHPHQKAL